MPVFRCDALSEGVKKPLKNRLPLKQYDCVNGKNYDTIIQRLKIQLSHTESTMRFLHQGLLPLHILHLHLHDRDHIHASDFFGILLQDYCIRQG